MEVKGIPSGLSLTRTMIARLVIFPEKDTLIKFQVCSSIPARWQCQQVEASSSYVPLQTGSANA